MNKSLLFLLLLQLISLDTLPCTAIIISGKATPDGRPILWKHRDTDEFRNDIRTFNDGKYPSIGLINSPDKKGESLWGGYNTAGFAIINTHSYNLSTSDTVNLKDQDGIIMREALKVCSTLQDFELLLQNSQKPLGVVANFGVIDASGGAAWFEVDHFSWKKLDVNDPALAPFGYMIHTNFSFTGDPQRGSGHIRYKTAEDLFYRAAQQHNLTIRFILQEVSRSLWHSLTATDLKQPAVSAQGHHFVHFSDFIPRYSSTASIAIQGVKAGENTDYTTMWTILGWPLTSVVFPVWLSAGADQPELLILNTKGTAPLCDKSLQLKEQVFPVSYNYKGNYINLAALYNDQGTGIMQKLKPFEDEIFNKSLKKLETWRQQKEFRKEIPAFYREISTLITEKYKELFGI